MSVEESLRLMKTLDDAWNSLDGETFKKRHASNVDVYWPGQPEPTVGRDAHHKEAVEFFKTFLTTTWRTIHIIFFSAREIGHVQWQNSQARLKGPMMGPNGKFDSTYEQKISKRVLYGGLLDEREIVEEKLFYYLVGGYEAARPDVNLLFHHVYYTRVW